jgi:hypothetical protein
LSFYVKKTPWTVYSLIIYIPISLIALQLLGLSYLIYLSKSQKNPSMVLIRPMRYIWNLMYTVLFLPFTDLMISVLACKKGSDGISYNKYYSDVVCWQGSHIFNGTIAIISFVLIILLGFPFVATYFDSTGNENNPRTR